MLALHIINSIKYYYLYCKNATELQHNFEAEVELNSRDAHACARLGENCYNYTVQRKEASR